MEKIDWGARYFVAILKIECVGNLPMIEVIFLSFHLNIQLAL